MHVVSHALPYNRSLDGLRGIAILLVVLFHIWPSSFSFGFVGVDIFFVLSGYLITKIILHKLESNSFSFLVFYRNRIRRILPATIIVLAVSSLIAWLFLFPEELVSFSQHLIGSVLFYQNFQLLDEVGYWDQGAQFKPLLHFWSLSIEEQFYVFWPLLLVFIVSVRRNIYLLSIGLLLIAIVYMKEGDYFYHSFSRFWELALGASLLYFEKERYVKLFQKWRWLIWVLFVSTVASFTSVTAYEHFHMLILCLITGLLILSTGKLNDTILSNRLLVFFGLISFPLYLWHYPIISFAHVFAFSVEQLGLQILALSVFISFLTYRYIEVYARRQEGYTFSLVMLILALLLVLWGYYVQKQGGLPERSEIQRISSSLEQLKKPETRDNQCMSLVKGVVGEAVYLSHCRMHTAQENSSWLALIGDSHAYVMYPGIAKEAHSKGLTTLLLSRDSCPVLLGGARGGSLTQMRGCEKAIQQTFKVLEHAHNLKHVVIVSRGPVYIYGKGYGSIEQAVTDTPIKHKNHFDEKAYSEKKSFFQSLDATIRYLHSRGISITVMLENPELGFDVKQCIQRPYDLFSDKCTVPFQAYQNRMHEYRGEMEVLVSKYEGVRLLDPEPYMCGDIFCFGKDQHNIFYADDDHLSRYGSEYLAKKFFGGESL